MSRKLGTVGTNLFGRKFRQMEGSNWHIASHGYGLVVYIVIFKGSQCLFSLHIVGCIAA